MYRWRALCLLLGSLLGLLFGPVSGVGPSAQAQNRPGDAEARISVERDGAMLSIIPTYTLPDTVTPDTTALRYDLTVERTGASTSRSRQGGTFTPVPGRTDTLSTVRLNAVPGDRLHLHLVVRRNEQVIAEMRCTEATDPSE